MTPPTSSDQSTADWWMVREAALTVVCPEPGCNQAPGDVCRNVHTALPLNREPAHWRRVKASNQPPTAKD